MHPSTPYPVSARTKSKSHTVSREMPFREITAKVNAISKSSQFSSQESVAEIKKMEEEQAQNRASKTPNSRRYSVASKFAGPKVDSNGNPDLQSKSKLTKRASSQGFTTESHIHAFSDQTSSSFSKGSSIMLSKSSVKGTSVQSSQTTISGQLRRQSLASGLVYKNHKSNMDVFKRSAPEIMKSGSTQPRSSKPRGVLLKSADYWIEQVKLAEEMELYGVSIGFFRLAIECGAEPIESLKEELIAFIRKFSMWSDTTQQLLQCYGVTIESQKSLFKQFMVPVASQSSLHVHVNINGDEHALDREIAQEPSEISSEAADAEPRIQQVAAKDKRVITVKDALAFEDVASVQNTSISGVAGPSVKTEEIVAMDAETITREVVSCIMSSIYHTSHDGSGRGENSLQRDENDIVFIPSGERLSSRATEVAAKCGDSVQPSVSDPSSSITEATSSDSFQSPKVWDMKTKEPISDLPAGHNEANLTQDNDSSDSGSASRVSGGEMCVSMDLVDTLSDDLQSSKPNRLSIEDDLQSSRPNRLSIEGIITHSSLKPYDDSALECANSMKINDENRAATESCDFLSSKSRQIDNDENVTSAKSEVTQALLKNAVSEIKADKTVYSSRKKRQNGKEKVATPADRKKTVSPSETTDKPAPRRLSIATPKSTPARIEAVSVSRSRGKGIISQPTKQGSEQSRYDVVEPDVNVATPMQDRRSEVGDGPNQVPSNISDVFGMRTTETPGFATPGPRRSARLTKTSSASTPNSNSTPSLQKGSGIPR
ncbi:hypothetical protein KP509_20G020000 [Ceratopteris richardii]|uniref:Uncharacterized protein n=1 Tax=Ceratopteris richardii TaxID=49495 RepID=A0A8T2SGP1_CERRI|nr:hypothetical protein KP509_20G020000 [Ceratopteris richardii]